MNTQHLDPDSGLAYRTTKVRVRKGLICCDRILTNSKGDASKDYETIHAMDVALFTLISNPSLPCPLLEPSSSLQDFLDLITRDSTVVKPRQESKKRKISAPTTDQSKSDHKANQEHFLNQHQQLEQLQQSDLSQEHVGIDNTQKIRRSTRLKALTTRIFMIKERGADENLDEFSAEDVKVPKSHSQATHSALSFYWVKAEESELKGIKYKDCYEIIDIEDVPAGESIIPAKWVYAVKLNSNGKIVRFKARLTARGDLVDIEDLDFQDIYSPVVSWPGFRIFLALTVLLGLHPLQIDVDLAYLYADLETPVYMRPPDGAGCPPNKCWRLKKSLYGLPQSGKNWNKLIVSIFLSDSFDLHQLITDTCLFIRNKSTGEIVLLCLYVDDIYLATSTIEQQREFIAELSKHLKLKILGVPDQMLGLTNTWGVNFKYVHLSVGKTIRKLMQLLDLDGS